MLKTNIFKKITIAAIALLLPLHSHGISARIDGLRSVFIDRSTNIIYQPASATLTITDPVEEEIAIAACLTISTCPTTEDELILRVKRSELEKCGDNCYTLNIEWDGVGKIRVVSGNSPSAVYPKYREGVATTAHRIVVESGGEVKQAASSLGIRDITPTFSDDLFSFSHSEISINPSKQIFTDVNSAFLQAQISQDAHRAAYIISTSDNFLEGKIFHASLWGGVWESSSMGESMGEISFDDLREGVSLPFYRFASSRLDAVSTGFFDNSVVYNSEYFLNEGVYYVHLFYASGTTQVFYQQKSFEIKHNACPLGYIWNDYLKDCFDPEGEACIASGRIWNASDRTCSCADGKIWDGTECIVPVDPEEKVCTESGRIWNASDRTCSCADGKTWDGTACITVTSAEDLINNKVKVYTVNSMLKIEGESVKRVTVFTATGQTVYEGNNTNIKLQIVGIYFVRVETVEGNHSTHRVVIQ